MITKTAWRSWWAWYPVQSIGNQWIWFQWCYRQTEIIDSLDGISETIEYYATVFELLQEGIEPHQREQYLP